VSCLAWDHSGRWLLSGSADLTTRLHAKWSADQGEKAGAGGVGGWRQLARPQVHGHIIACLAALPSPSSAPVSAGSLAFVSGADEKTLRVFDAPGTFLGTVARSLMPGDAAGVAALEAARTAAGDSTGAQLPQLGLSNKALHAPSPGGVNPDTPGQIMEAAPSGSGGGGGDGKDVDDDSVGSVIPSVLSAPPPEEVLAQATLWPEARKLYGHGNDLVCVAAHPLGTLVASASRAQSAGAAAVWVWDSALDWRQGLGPRALLFARVRNSTHTSTPHPQGLPTVPYTWNHKLNHMLRMSHMGTSGRP